MKLKILYEDESIIVAVKPAGVPSQDDRTNSESMLSMLKLRIFEEENLKEEPYLAAIHRLDRPVGGIMVFARGQEAAAALSEQSRDGSMKKYYQAVLTGELPNDAGELNDYLYHDKQHNITKVVPEGTEGSKYACLTYEVLDVFETDGGALSYVLIQLGTGRHHQIRVQMAHAGAGIYGDKKYNPAKMKNAGKRSSGGYEEIALHASRLEFDHPVTGAHMCFKDEPEGGAFEVIELAEF